MTHPWLISKSWKVVTFLISNGTSFKIPVPKDKYGEWSGIYCLGLFSCATQHSSPRFHIRCDSLQKKIQSSHQCSDTTFFASSKESRIHTGLQLLGHS